jgi:hypothetical protein
LETEHWSDSALDPSVILLNAVVQIFVFPDRDWLATRERTYWRVMRRFAGNNGLMVRLAPVDDDAIGSAMATQGFLEEQLCRRQIPMLAEMKLYSVANAVDGPVDTSSGRGP